MPPDAGTVSRDDTAVRTQRDAETGRDRWAFRADGAVLGEGMVAFHRSVLRSTLTTTTPAQKMTTVSNMVS